MNLHIESEPLNHNFIKHHIKGMPFNASLNQFVAPDTGNIAHCHPYDFRTTILHGGYIERVFWINPYGSWGYNDFDFKPGHVMEVKAETIHQIIGLPNGECWTLFQPHSGHIRKSREYRFEDNGIWSRAWDETEFTPYQHNLTTDKENK